MASTLQQYWNDYSDYYTNDKHTRPINFQLIMNLRVPEAKNILEVGAGYGKTTVELARLSAPDCRIVATDYSPKQLQKLRQAVGDLEKVETLQADARALPFDDESFDRFLAPFVIHLVPKYEQCIREAARVLKPGGLAAFSIWGREEETTVKSVPLELFEKAFGSEWRKRCAPPAQPGASPALHSPIQGHSNFACARDPAALVALFRAAGFRRCIYWYTRDAAVNFANADDAARRFGQMPAWRKLFREASVEERERFHKLFVDKVEQLTDENRSLDFEAMCILASK